MLQANNQTNNRINKQANNRINNQANNWINNQTNNRRPLWPGCNFIE